MAKKDKLVKKEAWKKFAVVSDDPAVLDTLQAELTAAREAARLDKTIKCPRLSQPWRWAAQGRDALVIDTPDINILLGFVAGRANVYVKKDIDGMKATHELTRYAVSVASRFGPADDVAIDGAITALRAVFNRSPVIANVTDAADARGRPVLQVETRRKALVAMEARRTELFPDAGALALNIDEI